MTVPGLAERDVRELRGIQKRREFEVFVRMCALRTAQSINLQELARDAGVSAPMAKETVFRALTLQSRGNSVVHPRARG